jgi:RNA polymerase sigma-70 factor (ECF subfamily)
MVISSVDIQKMLRAGDPAVLSFIYDAYAARLHAYLGAFTGSEAEADDMLQELFVAIARRPTALADATNLEAYLVRMARNLAIDHQRRRRTSPSPDRETQVDCRIERSETKHDVNIALASLPEDQREVVVLKLWQGLTFAEIADATHVGLNTAASRYRYAIDKLRTLLGDHHVD